MMTSHATQVPIINPTHTPSAATIAHAQTVVAAFANPPDSGATGLSADTIRFYVRRGLLVPDIGAKGGANPYQIFTQEHVKMARMIRMGQSLGMPLKEIAALNAEFQAGGMTLERSIVVMEGQLAKLEEKAKELETMTGYMRRKLSWLKAGATGAEPAFPLQGWTGDACTTEIDGAPVAEKSPMRNQHS